jgi:hypothetical protein
VVYCVKSFLTFSFILGSWFSSKLSPFEQENTTQCAESIQSSFVENNESRQHNPLTLENSALEETLHFKQDDSVVHLESLLENQDPSMKENVRKDLTQYTTYYNRILPRLAEQYYHC